MLCAMSTLNIPLFQKKMKIYPKESIFASWPGAMINPLQEVLVLDWSDPV